MKTLIINSTPKTDGHCVELTNIAVEAAKRAGAEYELFRLADLNLDVCHMCGDGWGTCSKDFRCAFENDGFNTLHEKLAWTDSLLLITPVYWTECSEAMKEFMDRVRRCEGAKALWGDRKNSLLFHKIIQIIKVFHSAIFYFS